jgi:hypothetical protein
MPMGRPSALRCKGRLTAGCPLQRRRKRGEPVGQAHRRRRVLGIVLEPRLTPTALADGDAPRQDKGEMLVEIGHLDPQLRPHSDDPNFWATWTGAKTTEFTWESVVAHWLS